MPDTTSIQQTVRRSTAVVVVALGTLVSALGSHMNVVAYGGTTYQHLGAALAIGALAYLFASAFTST